MKTLIGLKRKLRKFRGSREVIINSRRKTLSLKGTRGMLESQSWLLLLRCLL
jgi:hypothetical protein